MIANVIGVTDRRAPSRFSKVVWAARNSTIARLPDSRRRMLLPSTAQTSLQDDGMQVRKSLEEIPHESLNCSARFSGTVSRIRPAVTSAATLIFVIVWHHVTS